METKTAVTEKGKVPKGVAELWAMIDKRFNDLEEIIKTKIPVPPTITGGRGPVSTRAMTTIDAEKIMLGELKDKTIKECAITLGLSYGQVYSARNGYTFKDQYALKVAEKLRQKATK